jgi:long-subunit fatty acid transport protein
MKLSRWVVFAGTACLPHVAAAGGLFLPGAGAISTSRAGAGVASADDGEAISLNPAGIAKAKGNTITISAAMLSYAMQFQRRGTYDPVDGEGYTYANQPYPVSKNDASPPLGIGSVQPVPVVAFITDLGGAVPGLHVGIGLYAPNAYPFRDMCSETSSGCQKFQFNQDFTSPPPSTRYDIMKQDAAVILPSLAVAYSVLPNLDVGARFSAGIATLKSTTALWGTPGANYSENVKADAVFVVDAQDNFVPTFGVGATYRPTPNLELAANYSYKLDIHARGTATSQLGPSAGIEGFDTSIVPKADDDARCATGGTIEALKACVDVALPQSLTIGGRYKFLDHAGNLRGDIELDLDWENWGKSCPSDSDSLDAGDCMSPSNYRVIVDAQAQINGSAAGIGLKTAIVEHNLKDSYGAHLGGSYHIPLGPVAASGAASEVIVRGGVGYDSATARDGWLRADLDGAARTTVTLGAAYRTKRFEVDLGGGASLEGSQSNPSFGGSTPCNPTLTMATCPGGGTVGPNPINPLLPPGAAAPGVPGSGQFQNPTNQGVFKAHYLLFMLGVTTWF